MITLDDIDSLVVDRPCATSYPCYHSSKVVLKDGRTVSNLSSLEICSIVSKLALERINPNNQDDWKNIDVKGHFSRYSEKTPDVNWVIESPEIVLNRIFSKK